MENYMAITNCCICNHPCPIQCSSLSSCQNNVLNPVLTVPFAFFSNTSTQTVVQNGTIALNLIESRGSEITPSTEVTGAITLSAGTYQLSYLAGGIVPSGGTLSIKLRLDGVDVEDSILTVTQTADTFANLTQSIIITVLQSTTLELVNNSAQDTTYSIASISLAGL